MTRRRLSRGATDIAVSFVLGSCVCLASPGRAFAQSSDANAADIAAARTLAVEGVKLAQAGKCDEAVDKLERAEKLHHAPIVLAALGECRVSQGHLVEGTEMLRKVLREPLPEHPTPALTKAYEHAQSTLDAATPKIGKLVVSVSAQGEAQPAVTVDGESVPSALLGAERPTDPGEHSVEATSVGYLKANAKVSLGEGEKKSVKLELERDPSYVAPAAAAPEEAPHPAVAEAAPPETRPALRTPAPAEEPPRTHESPNHTAAYISWIVGGAALAVGGGFGIAAMSGKNDLDKQCNGNVCPPSQKEKLDAATRNGTIATIGFGVGAAGIALGTVLFFTVGGSSESHESTALAHTPKRASGPKLRAGVGLGHVQLAGEF
ncbi:MAG TPA: hypothetical protein VHC69_17690 [Polyangiaceae bacterium]|nr:hypothetical protein [Polyangiaceae bacterium]